jgi:hypothetical protein
MGQVLKAWRMCPQVSHGSQGGASLDAIAKAERVLGRSLPRDLIELYMEHDGGDFVGGNIQLFPLHAVMEDESTLTTASVLLRLWQWPIPPELVMFASDGSDGCFGLWFSGPETPDPLVVELAESFSPDSLAVVGDTLAGFLAGRSAYYLVGYAMDGYATEPALDVLGVPDELRFTTPSQLDDDAYFAMLRWANPGLPDPRPDPYRRGLTPAQVNEVARRTPRP